MLLGGSTQSAPHDSALLNGRVTIDYHFSQDLTYSAARPTPKICFVHNGRSNLLILALCNPFILEARETCQDGSSNPCIVLAHWCSNNVDLQSQMHMVAKTDHLQMVHCVVQWVSASFHAISLGTVQTPKVIQNQPHKETALLISARCTFPQSRYCTLMEYGARSEISLYNLSAMPDNIVVPPDSTTLPKSSFLMAALHFLMELTTMSAMPGACMSTKLGVNSTSGHLNLSLPIVMTCML